MFCLSSWSTSCSRTSCSASASHLLSLSPSTVEGQPESQSERALLVCKRKHKWSPGCSWIALFPGHSFLLGIPDLSKDEHFRDVLHLYKEFVTVGACNSHMDTITMLSELLYSRHHYLLNIFNTDCPYHTAELTVVDTIQSCLLLLLRTLAYTRLIMAYGGFQVLS